MPRNGVRLLVALGASNLGFWLLWPAGIVRVEALGWGEAATGLFGSAAWAGCLLGIGLAPGFIRSRGHRAVTLLSFVLLAAAGLCAPPLEWFWTVLAGLSLGLRWTTLDAWLVDMTAPASHGRVLSVVELVAGGTFALGPAMGALLVPAGGGLAIAAAAVACAASGAASLRWIPNPARDPAATQAPGRAGLGRPPLGIPFAALAVMLAAGALSGVFESGFAAAASLLVLSDGGSERAALVAATAVGAGSFSAQYWLGVLADRRGGYAVLFLCSGALSAALVALAFWPGTLVALSIVVGAAGGGLYTVAVIYGLQSRPGRGAASAGLIGASAVAATAGVLVAPAAAGASPASSGW